jgi:hypothetical protein
MLHGAARDLAGGSLLLGRFIHEPDLWRAHLRTIFSLQDAIEATTRQGDEAERSVKNAEYFTF